MNAHTSGPWVIVRRESASGIGQVLEVLDANGDAVCNDETYYPTPLDERNAPLIAAAPDLLNTLRELVEIVDAAISAGDWKVDGCCDPSLSLDWALAAIAKAEGRA
jgi:hypothetical protein